MEVLTLRCAILFVVALAGLSGLPGMGARAARADELSGVTTCQPGTGAQSYTAPAPAGLAPVIALDRRVASRLAARGTVNVAGPWLNTRRHGVSDYGIFWHSWNSRPAGGSGIWLKELLWAYSFADRQTDAYWKTAPGLKAFQTGRDWPDRSEYGGPELMDYRNPAYPAWLAAVARRMLADSGADGLLLDWWIDDHPGSEDAKVATARTAIARALRKALGDGPILMGNVGRTLDGATASVINGAFLEIWKKQTKNGYSCAEIAQLERALMFYDRELRQPKLVVFEPWRITRRGVARDRSSPANLRMAGVFTAMASVIPRNGYILYSDNARDSNDSDHDHQFYDIYRTDLGRATSGYSRIAAGLGYRRFERGVAIYNISPSDATVRFPAGVIRVRSVEGLFCRQATTGYVCT